MRPRATALLAAMVVKMCSFTSAPFSPMATASWKPNNRWSFPSRKAPRVYRLPTWCRFRKTEPDGWGFANEQGCLLAALFFIQGSSNLFFWPAALGLIACPYEPKSFTTDIIYTVYGFKGIMLLAFFRRT